jgi:uncharacterized phage protein (TIGR02218 family)
MYTWMLDYTAAKLSTYAEVFGFIKAQPIKPTTSGSDTAGIARNELWLTSYPEPVTLYYDNSSVDSDIYGAYRTAIPAPITRTAIQWTFDPRDTEVDITVQSVQGIAQQLLSSMNNNYRVVILLQSVETDISHDVLFKGQGVPTMFEGNGITIKARADAHILDLLVPDIVYQRQCNNILFDSRCGLTQTAWCSTVRYGDIDDVTGGWYAAALAGYDENYFYLGQVVIGDWATSRERRLVTYSGSGTVMFSPVFERTIGPDEIVTFSPGCDKFHTTCKNKFSNNANFFGMPDMPIKNPASQGIL